MRKSTIFGLTAGLALSAGIVFAAQSVAGSPATQAEVSTDGNVTYVLAPAAGSCVQEISTITVTFDAPNVGFYDNTKVATLSTADGQEYSCSEPMKSYNAEGQAVYTLEFKESPLAPETTTITEEGFYTLVLRGWYTSTLNEDETENVIDLPVMTAAYTVYPVEMAIFPANGLNLVTTNFEEIILEFGEDIDIDPLVTGDDYPVTLVNTTTNTTYVAEFMRPLRGATVYSFKTFFDPEDPWAEVKFEAGEYTFTASQISNAAGEQLPNIVSTFTLYEPVAYTLDPAPEVGEVVSTLNGLTITFEDPNVGFYEGSGAVLENIDTQVLFYANEPNDLGRNENGYRSFSFDFYEYGSTSIAEIPFGNYKLTIRGAYQSLTDEEGEIIAEIDQPLIFAEYQVMPEGFVTINPETNSAVTDLTTIEVTFNAAMVGYYENSRPGITLTNATTEVTYTCPYPQLVAKDENSTTYKLSFYEEGKEDSETVATIDQVGEYVLSLRNFYVNIAEDAEAEEVQVAIPAVLAEYSLIPAGFVSYNPEDGATVESLTTIKVTFESGIVGYAQGSPVSLENTTSGNIYEGVVTGPARNDDGNNVFTISFRELGSTEDVTVNEVGTYVLSLRGFYLNLEEDIEAEDNPGFLPAFTANYTVLPEGYVTYDPENGSTVSDLSTITVTFQDKVGYTDAYPANAILENTTSGESYYGNIHQNTRVEGGSEFVITFSELGGEEPVTVDEVGNYVLSLRGFYNKETEVSDEIEYSYLPVFTANYTVVPEGYVTYDPENGSTVSDLSKITVTFQDKVGYTEAYPSNAILENTTTGVSYYGSLMKNTRAEAGSEYTITFSELGGTEPVTVDEVGNYVLTLRGFYNNETEVGDEVEYSYLPVMTAEYSLVPANFVSFDPESGSTVETISNITVTFQGKVSFTEAYPANAILENTSNGEVYYATPLVNPRSEEGTEYTLSFTELGGDQPVTITEVGNYVLSLRGFYVNQEEDIEADEVPGYLPVFTAAYSLIPEGFLSLDPESGSTVESISKITLTFEGKVGYTDAYPGNAILENNSNGDAYYCTAPFLEGYDEDGNSIYSLRFTALGGDEPVEVTEMGNYTLTIRGFYNNASVDEDGDELPMYLPVFTAAYTIIPEGVVTFDPASGSEVSDLSQVNVTFQGRVGFTEVRPGNAVLENTMTGEAYYALPQLKGYDENGNTTYTLDFYEINSSTPATVNKLGSYVLALRGFYSSASVDEEGDEVPMYLPTISANYTLYPEGYYTLTPESGCEVDEIYQVVVTFNEDPNIAFEEIRPAPVVLENLTTGDVWYCEYPLKSRTATGGSQFVLDFTANGSSEIETITYNGEYLLTLKGIYSSVLNEDETETDTYLPNIYATYYIVNGTSGIEEVIDADTYNVYGINGVQLIKNGKASDLNSLNAGIYIINGKKVILRK